MSIYIKNAKMPECCAECPFDTFADDLHYCTIKQLSTEDYWECRPPLCPLIEVPEPHGRLIDVDALANDLEADGKEFGDEMKLNCASWLRSNATPTVIESEEEE